MLDPKLLNILACPDCKLDLIYRRVEKKETLVCSKCHRVFQIENGTPQMQEQK